MATRGQFAAWASILAGLAVLVPASARSHVAELEAVLDTQQEVPAPSGTTAASGTGEFVLEEDGSVAAQVSFQGLTAAPILAHIHEGGLGVPGPVVVDFTPGLSPSGVSGTGSAPLTAAQQQTLFAGGMYFNVHTPANLGGEIRGQIRLKPGACSCDEARSPGAFKACVKRELRKALKVEGPEEKRAASVRTLKRLVAKSACGKTKAPKALVACCLPIAPAQNVVTDRMCAAVKAAQCAQLGGTSLGAGVACGPNPCRAGSPSGAFLTD